MEFETFISRLEEVRDVARIENGYSHIVYNIMYEHVLNSDYMLVDVSTYKRKSKGKPINVELLGKNLCAVPDFVITKKTKLWEEIEKNRLGCIEVKFNKSDLDGARLYNEGNKKGYLETYNNHVIYTNGWIWKYYDGSDETRWWTVDFAQEEQRNAVRYSELIEKLKEIKWEELGNITV